MTEGTAQNAERGRLAEADAGVGWRRWGPYVSARQWGTVREDYSKDGQAWSYLPHDHARSRAYRWGEDGIAGVCDDQQILCLALALWNGRDPILKERFFGLSGPEGNHGEDVKEYWFHRDSTPTHSYMNILYKYPQREFPYLDLVQTNARRGRTEFEYELLDTGVFDGGEYFDVEVEYAKATPEDLVMRVTVHNRSPQDATVQVLPTLWFRNTWSPPDQTGSEVDAAARPRLSAEPAAQGVSAVSVEHPDLGRRQLLCGGEPEVLFTENETNTERIFGTPNAIRYVKDGVGRFVVDGDTDAVNPARTGTKAAAHYVLDVPAGGSAVVRLRLTDGEARAEGFADDVDALIAQRQAESDAFYAELISPKLGEDERDVVRRALAGMLLSKQYYEYDVERWLHEHDPDSDAVRRDLRNADWVHLRAGDVISMPDSWEYPWFAAWDLAFHCIPLAMVDLAFAKQQLALLLTRRYQHPNGQIPAYEWNFSDVNPPVHGWASYFVYQFEKSRTGKGDVRWLENQFQKLAQNFAWWVNRKDPDGNNVFQGGFLGLDNIGVFDRSAPLPTGGSLDQADGTAWMALYCQTMLQIALELAEHDDVYLEQAAGYLEHFGWIALAVGRGVGGTSMWDEGDGFFYDLLRFPDGSSTRLAVRSMVGLLPLGATTHIDAETAQRFPEIVDVGREFIERHAGGPSLQAATARHATGRGGFLLGIFDEHRVRRILARMLDEGEFLGPHGLRSVSKVHEQHPYEFWVGGQVYRVRYMPAESDTGMFGGNSNWRGPVWFPVNALLIRALLNMHAFYGDAFRVECPTGSGRELTLYEVAREISDRLTRTFLRGPDGRRPVYGGTRMFQEDPYWRDLLIFPEYMHGDNGAALGASHQTGWTGLVAVFPQLFAVLDPDDVAVRGLWAQPRSQVPGAAS